MTKTDSKLFHSTYLFLTLFFFGIVTGFFTGCNSKVQENRVVIWTDCSEFAQYIELFNKTHTDNNAILVYKENPALSLPPAKDELPPDIIIGSYLRNDKTTKYFKQIDFLFDRKSLDSSEFYPQLLEFGQIRKSQYLLPVSFNLPAVIFANKNKNLVSDNYTLSLEDIRKIGSEYNQKNKKGVYTRIGFTPLSNEGFLYLTTKFYNVDIHEEKGKVLWNQENLDKSVAFLKDWINTENTSATIEQDFSYKYLFAPYYRQVNTDRTLFSYTRSDDLFKVISKQDLQIDYRWICQDDVIPIEDDFIMLGVYKNCNNFIGSTEFLIWFFQAENQNRILEKKSSMNLETNLFGIAGGFSAVRDVNEHILPIYYTQLLSNLPPSQKITVTQKLPARWESYKSAVVDAYLKNALTQEDGSTVITMEEFEKEWQKKVFEQ